MVRIAAYWSVDLSLVGSANYDKYHERSLSDGRMCSVSSCRTRFMPRYKPYAASTVPQQSYYGHRNQSTARRIT